MALLRLHNVFEMSWSLYGVTFGWYRRSKHVQDGGREQRGVVRSPVWELICLMGNSRVFGSGWRRNDVSACVQRWLCVKVWSLDCMCVRMAEQEVKEPVLVGDVHGLGTDPNLCVAVGCV